VIFAIHTRTIPFFRSHPSLPLTLAALGAVAIGTLLPATPLAHMLGFQPLPGAYFAALVAMVLCYLGLIELGKRIRKRWTPLGTQATRYLDKGRTFRLLSATLPMRQAGEGVGRTRPWMPRRSGPRC